MNSTGPYASAALHGHPTWKYRWEAPRSSPVPNHLSRLLNRFHQKIYAPLSIQLVGNSFVSPTLSLPLSLKHPAAPPSPRTRSPEARGRLVAGVFDAAIAACWCWCVVCCCCCLWNDPARAYCLLLDLGGSIGRAQHTHTHTHIEGGGWVGNKQPIHAVMWIERWRTEITCITKVKRFHSEVRYLSVICELCNLRHIRAEPTN